MADAAPELGDGGVAARQLPAANRPPVEQAGQPVGLARLREQRVLYVGCGEDIVPLYLFPGSDFIYVDSLNFLGSDCQLGPARGVELLFGAIRGLRDFVIDEHAFRATRLLHDGTCQTVQFLHEAWAPSWCPDWLSSVQAMYFCGWAPVSGMEPVLDWSTLKATQRNAFFDRNFRAWAKRAGLQLARIYTCNSCWVYDFAKEFGISCVEVPYYQFLLTPASWRPKHGGTWASLKFGADFRERAPQDLLSAFRARGVTLREGEDDSASSSSSSSVGPKPLGAGDECGAADEARDASEQKA